MENDIEKLAEGLEQLVEAHPLMGQMWKEMKNRERTSDNMKEENKTLQALYKHRAQMAPHQKDRQSGFLLLEAIKEIEILIDAYSLKKTQVENLRELLKDECAEDTAIRKLATPIIGEQKAEGDSMGVPTITDVVEEVIKSLLAACNLTEQVRLQETRHKIKAEDELAEAVSVLNYYAQDTGQGSIHEKARELLQKMKLWPGGPAK